MMRTAELQIKVIQCFAKCVNHKEGKCIPQVSEKHLLLLPFGLQVAHSKPSEQHTLIRIVKGKAETYGVWTHRMTEILTKSLKLLVRPYKSFPTANVVMK